MSLLPCSPGEFPALGGNLGREGLRTHPLWLSPAPPPPQEGRKGCGNPHSRAQAAALLRSVGSPRGQCCPQFDFQNPCDTLVCGCIYLHPKNTLSSKLFRALGRLRPLCFYGCAVCPCSGPVPSLVAVANLFLCLVLKCNFPIMYRGKSSIYSASEMWMNVVHAPCSWLSSLSLPLTCFPPREFLVEDKGLRAYGHFSLPFVIIIIIIIIHY